MKRVQMEQEIIQRLPNEIIVDIILQSFRFRIKTSDEWQRLHLIFSNLIQLGQKKKIGIYSRIVYVCPSVMCRFSYSMKTQFHQIEKIAALNVLDPHGHEWDTTFSILTNLRNLKFPHGSVSFSIDNLTNLEKLVCPFSVTDEAIKKLTKLKKLGINQSNYLTKDGFSYLTNLTNLSINYFVGNQNAILDNLKNLTKLTLNCSLGLPVFKIQGLENLRELSISKTTVLAVEPSRLVSLSTLKLVNCQIDFSIHGLTNLKRLVLSRILDIEECYLKGLTNLTSLALVGKSKIRRVPLELTNLTELNLSDSFIQFSPACHPKLLSLHLVDHKSIFNHNLKEMTNLTHLNLRDNARLGGDGLADLFSLKRLDISPRVRISEDDLSHLTNLILLTTDDNHEFFIEGLPTERWPFGYYTKREEKLKFFLND